MNGGRVHLKGALPAASRVARVMVVTMKRRIRTVTAGAAGLAAAAGLGLPAAAARAMTGQTAQYTPSANEWWLANWQAQQKVWPLTEGAGTTVAAGVRHRRTGQRPGPARSRGAGPRHDWPRHKRRDRSRSTRRRSRNGRGSDDRRTRLRHRDNRDRATSQDPARGRADSNQAHELRWSRTRRGHQVRRPPRSAGHQHIPRRGGRVRSDM